MSTILTIIIAVALYNMFFKVAYEKGRNFHEGIEIYKNAHIPDTEERRDMKLPVLGQRGYEFAHHANSMGTELFGYIKGDFNVFYRYRRELVIDGIFVAEAFNYVTIVPNVIVASLAHKGEHSWVDEYGVYECIPTTDKHGRQIPLDHYFVFHPRVCAHCGEPLGHIDRMDYTDNYSRKGPVNTSALKDSLERYCPKCRKELERRTETFYDFYIDTLCNKFVTSKDKQFSEYINELYKVKTIINQKKTKVPDNMSSACREANLYEYTKNIDTFDMWDRARIFN